MKKNVVSILILSLLVSTNISAQFLRWDWWKQNPALSLIGFNNSLNPIRSGGSVAEGTFTPGFGFRSLTPSALTSQKGISITQSDNLQYTRGSLQGGDGSGVVYENFDPNQFNFSIWWRPNENNTTGNIFYFFDMRGYGSDRISIYYDPADDKFKLYCTGSVAVASAAQTFNAGAWVYINAGGNFKADTYHIAVGIGGILNNYTATPALSPPANIETIFHIGSDYSNANLMNGVMTLRIDNQEMSLN